MNASPESVGMSTERLARIGTAIAPYIGDDKIAGAVTLVARRGKIVHLESVGVLDRETSQPMRDDAIFRIFSMTTLMMLYEQGRFQLIDPVSKWIPAFGKAQVYAGGTRAEMKLEPLKRPVTIRDLLTHTAGLTYSFLEYGPVEELCREINMQRMPLAEFAAALAGLPLAFQPGTSWRYSHAHDVVAHLVELISGQPFDVYLRERIFQPLGMADTGFFVPTEKQDRFAALYGSHNALEELECTFTRWVGDSMAGLNRCLAGPRDSLESAPHNVLRGGHGLVSTAQDYWRFCQMLLNNGELAGARLLGRKTLELMLANHIPVQYLPYEIGPLSSPGYGYGLGFRTLLDVAQSRQPGSVGEYGWAGAAGTHFWNDPQEQFTGILMIQAMPTILPITPALRAAAYQAIVD
jgi:CubicO group peptidase (beta-lactamase class C family)